jgi:two-component system cell cycle response regulator
MKALIVEPSRFFASVLSSMLLKYGFEADVVNDGEAGLEALSAHPYDLMCFAFALGSMSGNDFFLKAKMQGLVGHFPAFMITSGLDPRQRLLAQNMGVTDCLLKSDMASSERLIEQMAREAQEKLHGRVLLVEDSFVASEHYREVLAGMGLTVDHFKTAEEALQVLSNRQYDLVITDFMLEGEKTGLWLVRKLRESKGQNAGIPILAVSGFEEPKRKIDILRAGANDFVAKPVLTEELELRVRNLFKTQMLLRRLEMQFQHMRELALHDQLTGLYNRHYLDKRIPELFADCDQHGRSIAVIAIDIDHFKQINDSQGHHVGDQVLEAVAQVILDSGRKDAIAARLGGEEFMLLRPDVDLVRGAMRAEGMRHRLETLRPAGLRVTASMGVVLRNKGEAFEQLLQRADKLVYAAKQQGRNQVMAG